MPADIWDDPVFTPCKQGELCAWCLEDDYYGPREKWAVVKLDGIPVCSCCKRSYEQHLYDERSSTEALAYAELGGEPYYVDTMSGGCILLGSY